jgi:predicted O-methyltransferase YrrM
MLHWSPRYLIDRTLDHLYQSINPSDPWINRQAIKLLPYLLKKQDCGFEAGSGRSTIWLGQRVKKLISLEDNITWYQKTKELIELHGLKKKVNLLHVAQKPFSEVIKNFSNDSFDFCFIDGGDRGKSALLSIKKVRKGGLVIIDNINWYLPYPTRCWGSVKGINNIIDNNWRKFYNLTKSYRKVLTSDGISDLVIYFK